jgi:8-oxo-dGTP pyrophosphatase MutT (NUDIX family)
LREVREELGLVVSREDVLAELPMEQTRTTGYRVFPYLARITVSARWQIAAREVAQLFEVKLSDLSRQGAHNRMIERLPTWEKAQQVSFYQIGPHRLWGLSYRILHPIIPRLVAGDWDV